MASHQGHLAMVGILSTRSSLVLHILVCAVEHRGCVACNLVHCQLIFLQLYQTRVLHYANLHCWKVAHSVFWNTDVVENWILKILKMLKYILPVLYIVVWDYFFFHSTFNSQTLDLGHISLLLCKEWVVKYVHSNNGNRTCSLKSLYRENL